MSGRRRRGQRTLMAAALIGLFLLAGLASYTVASSGDPKAEEVVAITSRPATMPGAAAQARTLDGVPFPDWTRWGWTASGGRRDVVDPHHRAVDTTLYRKGSETIAVSVVEGTGDVNLPGDREIDRTPPSGKVALSEFGLPGSRVYSLRRKVRERSIFFSIWPVTQSAMTELQDMAVRL